MELNIPNPYVIKNYFSVLRLPKVIDDQEIDYRAMRLEFHPQDAFPQWYSLRCKTDYYPNPIKEIMDVYVAGEIPHLGVDPYLYTVRQEPQEKYNKAVDEAYAEFVKKGSLESDREKLDEAIKTAQEEFNNYYKELVGSLKKLEFDGTETL